MCGQQSWGSPGSSWKTHFIQMKPSGWQNYMLRVKMAHEGLERWLSGKEHILSFQRTRV